MGENGEWVKINLGFLRKPLQFSIHHSSFIIFAISTSPKFLRSPFFQTAKLIRKVQQAVAVQKTAHGPGHDQLPIVGAMYRIEHWIHSLEHEIEVCFFHTRLPSVGFVSQLDRTRGGLVPYSFLCVFAGPPSVKVDPGTDARDSYQSVPGKQLQTKIDGGRIECIGCVSKLDTEIFLGIQRSRSLNQCLREIRPNAPVPPFVCIGKGVSRYGRPESHVKKLFGVRPMTTFDIPKAFAVSHLSKSQAKKLVHTRKRFYVMVALVSFHAFAENIVGQMVHNLPKNSSVEVHKSPPGLRKYHFGN